MIRAKVVVLLLPLQLHYHVSPYVPDRAVGVGKGPVPLSRSYPVAILIKTMLILQSLEQAHRPLPLQALYCNSL